MKTKLIAFKMLKDVFTYFELKGHSISSRRWKDIGPSPPYWRGHLEHFPLPSFTYLSSHYLLNILLPPAPALPSPPLPFSSCSSPFFLLFSSSFPLPLFLLFSSPSTVPPLSTFLFFLLLPLFFLSAGFHRFLLWSHYADLELRILWPLPPKCYSYRCV